MAATSLLQPPPGPGGVPRALRLDPLQRRDGLTKGQLRAVIAAIAALHVGGGWALLQIPSVHEAVVEAVPIFVNLVPAPAPEPPKAEAPPPPPAPPPPKPVKPPPPAPRIAAAPSPAPAPMVVPPPPPEPAPEVTAPAAPAAVEAPPAPPAPAPAPAPGPITLPSSGVQYLVKPPLDYPNASKRLRESGSVVVRVHIDAKGMPGEVEVIKSSGFARLNQEAIRATRKARFVPPIVNGKPVPVVTDIQLDFNLED